MSQVLAVTFNLNFTYRAFHGFGQAKFADGSSVLGSSQFSILPQLPQKTMLGLKGVKIDSKISNYTILYFFLMCENDMIN